MPVISNSASCECGWEGQVRQVAHEKHFRSALRAQSSLDWDVQRDLIRHRQECDALQPDWDYVPTYKCDGCRQMVPIANNGLQRHELEDGGWCATKTQLPAIQVVNGGAQGTGKRR